MLYGPQDQWAAVADGNCGHGVPSSGPTLLNPAPPTAVPQGNRKYMRCLYVYNKVDMCSMEEVDQIAHWDNSIPISCSIQLNLDGLLERIWEMMALVGGACTPVLCAACDE